MKLLKQYEKFISDVKDGIKSSKNPALSNKTSNDILNGTFFDDEIKDKNVTIDNKGVVHIKNWKLY